MPHSWKQARVVPIYKSGDTSDAANYRPISVLPIISKILERHVYNAIYDYLVKHDLLLDKQSGFRKNHSCQTMLTKLTDYILEHLDHGQLCGALMIDLRKAFDLVHHDTLLHKIELYGMNDMTMRWLHSYLHDRTQTVSYDGHMSTSEYIKLGVPQGSILGPLFFIIFMNDVVLEISETQFDMYADDSTHYTSGQDVQQISTKLTEHSKPLCKWIDDNGMVLNVEKTECILFYKRPQGINKSDFAVSIGDTEIHVVNHHKLLGVHIDSKLSWEVHIDKLCAKLRNRLFLFNSIKHLLPTYTRTMYFDGMVQPLIDYGCTIWGSCSKQLLQRVHKLVKIFGRSILDIKDKREQSTVTIFQRLGWLPIDERIKYFKLVQMYNIMNGYCPTYLKTSVELVSNVHSRVTRQSTSDKLYVPRYKTNTGKKTFKYTGTILWNGLNTDITSAQTVDSFKHLYIQHVKQSIYQHEHFMLDR